jgi:hypothetical protein
MAAAPQQMCHSTVSHIKFFSPPFFFFDRVPEPWYTIIKLSLLDFSALRPLIPFLACWAPLLRVTDLDSFCFFNISAKKTKTKTTAPDSVTHSGPASPDSGEELTDNGEIGTERGEPDTAPTTAMTVTTTEDPDAAPDSAPQAPRFASLDSPADRYVLPLNSLPLSRDDRAFLSYPPQPETYQPSSPSDVDLNPAPAP